MLFGEVVFLEQTRSTLLGVGDAVDAREERHVVPDGEVIEEVRLIGDEGELSARLDGVVDDVVAADAYATRVHRNDAGETTQRRRLAGAVRPHQAEDLAFADAQRKLVHGGEAFVGLDELFDLDHGAGLYPLPLPDTRGDSTSGPIVRSTGSSSE